MVRGLWRLNGPRSCGGWTVRGLWRLSRGLHLRLIGLGIVNRGVWRLSRLELADAEWSTDVELKWSSRWRLNGMKCVRGCSLRSVETELVKVWASGEPEACGGQIV